MPSTGEPLFHAGVGDVVGTSARQGHDTGASVPSSGVTFSLPRENHLCRSQSGCAAVVRARTGTLRLSSRRRRCPDSPLASNRQPAALQTSIGLTRVEVQLPVAEGRRCNSRCGCRSSPRWW